MKSIEKNPRPESLLERRVSRSLSSCGVKNGSAIVVGVSGGPDSTALLSMLSRLAEKRSFRLHACIVDHGMRPRGEIDGDISFVESLARSLYMPVRVIAIPEGECAAEARRLKRSLEETARDLRLDGLERLASELGADSVALGHTQDDAVETLLMRIIQGSGPAGLAGMAARRGVFVRPMLGCTRREIMEYLEAEGLSYRTDSTNGDPAFLRNRVRALLVPLLERTFTGYRKGILSLARKLAVHNAFVEEESASRLKWRKNGRGFTISRGEFFQAPPALRAASLFSLYDRLRTGSMPRRLPSGFLRTVEAAVPGELSGHGMRLAIDGEAVRWETELVTDGEKGYFMIVGIGGSYAIHGTDVCVGIARGAPAREGDTGLRAGDLAPPLILRSKRKGDGLLLPYGRKPLKELFSDWKVPVAQRWEIPILADRKGIVAVLGRCRGAKDIVRAGAGGAESESDVTLQWTKKGSSEQ